MEATDSRICSQTSTRSSDRGWPGSGVAFGSGVDPWQGSDTSIVACSGPCGNSSIIASFSDHSKESQASLSRSATSVPAGRYTTPPRVS